MQMLSELVKLSCPTSLNRHSFMIAKNIQSPKILFPYEKKNLITKTLLIISVIFTRMRGKRNTNWAR